MTRQNLVYPYNRAYADNKRLHRYDFILMKCPEKANLQSRLVVAWGSGFEKHSTVNEHEGS
jgi:hypothetical protein